MYTLLDEAAREVQRTFRGKRTLAAYKQVRHLVSSAQAVIRGYIVRRSIQTIRFEWLRAYRRHICKLWRFTYTPLWYRSWFWSTINRYRFLHLALHQEELIRLWSELGLKPIDYGSVWGGRVFNTSTSSMFPLGHESDEEEYFPQGRFEQLLGLKALAVHQRFLIVQKKMDNACGTSSTNSTRLPIFPTETALKSSTNQDKNVAQKAQNLLASRKRLMKERDEIYVMLKNCKKNARYGTLNRFFEAFRIDEGEKEKKRKVVHLLWEHRTLAKASIEVVRLNEGYTDEFGNCSLHGTTGVTNVYQLKMREARNHLFFVQSVSGEDAAFGWRRPNKRKSSNVSCGKWDISPFMMKRPSEKMAVHPLMATNSPTALSGYPGIHLQSKVYTGPSG